MAGEISVYCLGEYKIWNFRAIKGLKDFRGRKKPCVSSFDTLDNKFTIKKFQFYPLFNFFKVVFGHLKCQITDSRYFDDTND